VSITAGEAGSIAVDRAPHPALTATVQRSKILNHLHRIYEQLSAKLSANEPAQG
jgi:hypothetical protein